MNARHYTITTYLQAAFLVAVCFLVACTARIDITTEDGEERLVIYGYITNDTTQHAIRITRSAGYFATTPPVGVSDAQVVLRTDNELISLSESPDTPGLYLTAAGVAGTEGKTYTLQVMLDFDEDGQTETFEASSRMPYSSEIDSITLVPSTLFDNLIEVQLYGRLPENDRSYFSFHARRNQVVLNDSLSGFFIVDDEHIKQNEFAGLACFYIDQDEENERLVSGDTVTLRVDVLPKDYADFLENARHELGGTNPIFGGPPANIETNIVGTVNPNRIPISGFFSAFSGREKGRVYEE